MSNNQTPLSANQRKNLTPLEFHDAMLRMLNGMNISLNAATAELTRIEKAEDEASQGFLSAGVANGIREHHTKVLNGISSLTSIFTKTRERILAEAAGAEMLGVQDLSAQPNQTRAERIQAVDQQVAAARQTFTKEADRVLDRVAHMATAAQNGQSTAPTPIPRQGNVLSTLLGPNGLLFGFLSPKVHPNGKGVIEQGDRFPAFVEELLSIRTSDLIEYAYPEGFYDTQGGVSNQLYLKTERLHFLWDFGADQPELFYLDAQNEWLSFNTLSKNTARLIGDHLINHLQAALTS